MRLRFLIRYAIRSISRFSIVLFTRSVDALSSGATNFKMILESLLALALAYLLVLSYGASLNVAIGYVEEVWGIHYTEITKEVIINALMPTIRTITLFLAAVYAFRYLYDAELSHAYAGLSLSIVALLVGILTGHEVPIPTVFLVLVLLALISSIHTYYYSVNMLEPYAMRLKRIKNVLNGYTHVPVTRLKAYVEEMKKKDRNFRSRLTLGSEIAKIGRVAVAAMVGSILSIALAITLAYATRYLAQIIFKASVYESISVSVETSQPEIYMIFIARLGSLLYIVSLRYSGLLKRE